MKICSRCGRRRRRSSFSKNKAQKDGLQSSCKDCAADFQRSYLEDPEKLARRVERNKSARERRRKMLREHKARPCADCGIQYGYWLMEYDHLPGTEKLGPLSVLAYRSSVKVFMEEIAKCEVVCVLCHANRTHWRRLNLPVEPLPLKQR